MKNIYLSSYNPRAHTSLKQMIDHPPENYRFVIPDKIIKKSFTNFLINSKLIKFLYRLLLKGRVNTSRIYESVFSADIPANVDLVFSSGRVLDVEKPWILEILDNPYCMTGYDFNLFIRELPRLEEKLTRSSCKRIIVVNESSMALMEKYFSKEVLKKTVLLRAGIKGEGITKKEIDNTFNILFLGSVANPDDFYLKGGLESLECFRLLSKDQDISMTLRCKVPEEVKKEYAHLRNLNIIEGELSMEDLEELYRKADILLSPAHHYVLMSSLEAMSHGLPIIALDTWGVRDYLNEKFAIIIKPSTKIKGYSSKEYPTNVRRPDFVRDIKNKDTTVIDALIRAISLLKDNPKLRRRMSLNAQKEIKKKFSLEERNIKLKNIFDKALKTQAII